MKDIKTKIINEKEYIGIGDIKHLDKIYTIYIDIETSTQFAIFEGENILEDEKIIREIASKVFSKKKYIWHEEKNEEQKSEELQANLRDGDETDYNEDGVEYTQISDAAKNKVIEYCKKVFFQKFGTTVLTDEELNERIEEGIKGIV